MNARVNPDDGVPMLPHPWKDNVAPTTQNSFGGGSYSSSPPKAEQDVFNGLQRVLVKQEFALSEVFGIEAKNRYRVSSADDPTGTFLFAQERSEACERICCAQCRALTMNVHLGHNTQGATKLSFEKRTHCPMLPCPILLHPGAWFITVPWICLAWGSGSGPELLVRRNGAVIGSVYDPPAPLFRCKGNSLIRDVQGRTIMHLGPICLCSVGMCCPCAADEEVPVTSVEGEQVATITRSALSLAELCGKMNRFVIDFGRVADPTHRALIFGAAMLFDLQYWEQR